MKFGTTGLDGVLGKIANIDSAGGVFALLLELFFAIGLVISIVFLIIGGINYITSKGDSNQAQSARTTITHSLIGIIIIIAFRLIVNLILGMLGLPKLEFISGLFS